MIEAGQVHASIDDAAGMVTFLEDPEQFHSAEVVERLSKQIALSNALAARVQTANRQVGASPVYHSNVVFMLRTLQLFAAVATCCTQAELVNFTITKALGRFTQPLLAVVACNIRICISEWSPVRQSSCCLRAR